MKIPFYADEKIPEAFGDTLQHYREESMAGAAEELEKLAAGELEVPHALTTSSSTSALHLAMCALDLKRGDKVICSVNAYVDVPEVVRHFDAEPIFADCDPVNYNIDIQSLEEKLDRYNHKKLRAVVVNHMAGLPAHLERIWELAERYDVKVVEEVSDAMGAEYHGRKLGTDPRSVLSTFSMGEKRGNRFDAGLLVTHDRECYDRAWLRRNHGMLWAANKSRTEYLYDVLDIGCQYRLNDYSALYARYHWEKVEEENRRRSEIADYYRRELKGLRHLRLPVEDPAHRYHFFIVEIDRNRDVFARKLREAGIETVIHYLPLHTMRYYKNKYKIKLFDYPNAMAVYQRVMSLPNRPEMSEEELAYVCETIRQIDAAHI
ncbi:DegT/DnrJ/EryC1/StrS family aminotransferase [Nitratifractor sp.]